MKTGGRWECSVRRKAYNATRQTNPVRRARLLESRKPADYAFYHAPDGGYIRRRRRALAAQRADILDQLDQLATEAAKC